MEKEFIPDLVSVIIPVYNSEIVLAKTLESVFKQTYQSIEIILVDDCSKDNSQKIIEKYLQNHPEITYFRQPFNQGAGVARNKALEIAKGQYVAFLDADDVWYPAKIEKQLELLKENKGFFCFAAIQFIDEAGQIVKSKRKVHSEISYKQLLRNTEIATSSVVIDRYVAGDFRMSLRRGGQDYSTWLKLLHNDKVAYGLNEVLVGYRVGNKNSLAHNKFKSLKQVWEIQIKDEKIKPFFVVINVLCFAMNALKKYLF